MAYVYATSSVVATLANGVTYSVREGDRYPDSDELVRERPDLFSREIDTDIETATAEPGQRRNTRRP